MPCLPISRRANQYARRLPLLPVFAYINGRSTEVQYSGGAPGEVAGVMQVNVKIPSSVSGNVPIVLQVGNAFSQPGVTIAVSGK